MIYVCYTEGSAVNVYDGESGAFLLAVSAPYLRHTYFDPVADRPVLHGGEFSFDNGSIL